LGEPAFAPKQRTVQGTLRRKNQRLRKPFGRAKPLRLFPFSSLRLTFAGKKRGGDSGL